MGVKQEDLLYIFEKLSEEERKRLSGVILITGCAGFLGYYFMHFFEQYAQKLGITKVIALDNFMLGKPWWIERLSANSLFEIHKFDIITDRLAEVAGCKDANYVIHMASIASPSFYRQYPFETLDANVWGLRALLDLYADTRLEGMLFFSSSELYGDPDEANIPTNEEYRGSVSATGPRACYDEAKRFGETMCMLYAQKYGMPVGVARPFNNYGPGMRVDDRRVPADFAKAVYEGKDIAVLSTGTPTRTFCYIADALVGYLKILLYGRYDYFNIGIDCPEITVLQLAEMYAAAGEEVFGYRGKVVFHASADADYLTHNPQRRCPDIQKARALLGYSPEIAVKDGVKRFLKFLKESDKREFIW